MHSPYYSASVEKPSSSQANHSLIESVGSMMGSFRQWSGGIHPAAGTSPEDHDTITADRAGNNSNGLVAMEAAFHQRFAAMVQEKDEELQQLGYKLRLREEAIEQLEQNILMQQESSEMIRRELEQMQANGGSNKGSSNGNKDDDDDSTASNTMEEEEMKETIEHLRKQLRGKNDANSTLTRTSAAQQAHIDRLESELHVLRQQMESVDTTADEMKEVMSTLQSKLLDKNNTNAALVRSAKLQSETISKLRAEVERLQDKASETKLSHDVELQQLEDKLNDMQLQFAHLVAAKHAPANEDDDDRSRASSTSSGASSVSRDLDSVLNTGPTAEAVAAVARARTPTPPPLSTPALYQSGNWSQSFSAAGGAEAQGHDDFSSDSGDEFSIYSDEESLGETSSGAGMRKR